MTAAPAVECRGIVKHFGAVRANDGVDLTAVAGEVHGIVGENGAGKSTLMAILHGELAPDSGEFRLAGRAVRLRSPRDAKAAGIGLVHQHFMLVDTFTVLENLLLGEEGAPLLRAGRARARADLARMGSEFGLALDPDANAGMLPVGLRQRLEILKALRGGARILILDEPTAVLTPQESERLFQVMRRLAAEGRTILFVTHKLREIMAATDRVSVMRAGRVVATRDTAAIDADALAELMIGRRLMPHPHPAPPPPAGEETEPEALSLPRWRGRVGVGAASPALEITSLTASGLRGISLAVRAGEIVGIAGVAGNGQRELLAAIVGITPATGSLRIAGREAAHLDIAARHALGLAHIAEDRGGSGLVAGFSAAESLILGDQRRPPFARGPFALPAAIAAAARQRMADYDVRPPDPQTPTGALSGGNQQKLLCAREMERQPCILVVGEPTRGVDIAAADFIHRRLLALKAAGTGILLVSADLDEIRTLADRILVMEGGRIAGELGPDAGDRDLGLLMGGVPQGSGPTPDVNYP